MKIGIAGFGHETITFWPGVTDLAAFERVACHGRDVIDKNRGVNSCIGGFIDVLESEGVEMLPMCDAMGGATATRKSSSFSTAAVSVAMKPPRLPPRRPS